MRTRFLAFMFAILTGTELFSQSKFSMGIEGAPVITSLFGSKQLDRWGPRFAFSGGFSFEYMMNNNAALRTGVYYEKKGNARGGIRSSFDYITLPVMMRFSSHSPSLNLFIDAGLFTGFLADQNFFLESGKNKSIKHRKSHFLPFDVGIVLGIGLKAPLSRRTTLGFEVRNSTGLINIDKKTSATDPVLTNSLGFFLSMNFRLGPVQ